MSDEEIDAQFLIDENRKLKKQVEDLNKQLEAIEIVVKMVMKWGKK